MPTVSRAVLLCMACDPFCYISAAFHLLVIIANESGLLKTEGLARRQVIEPREDF